MKNAPFLVTAALALCSAAQADTPTTTAPATPPTNAEITVKLTAPAGTGHPLALPFVLFQSPPPPTKPSAKDLSSKIKGLLTLLFKPPAVTSEAVITVQDVVPNPLVKDGYVAILSATAPMDAAAVTDAIQKAQNAVGKTTLVVSNIPVKPADNPPSPSVTFAYTLRFLRGPLPASDGTTPGGDPGIDPFGGDKAASDAATFLSKLYQDTKVQAHENHLVLTGPAGQVNALRQILALSLDVPSPQVKADVYTIQVNTTPHNRDAAQDKIEAIQAGIQIVRDLIHGSELVLGGYLASPQANVEAGPNEPLTTTKQKLFAAMRRDGYDPSTHRPLSLTDMLILLVPSNRAQFQKELTPRGPNNSTPNLTDALEKELFSVRRQLETGDTPLRSTGYNARDVQAYVRHGADLKKLLDRIETKVMLDRRDQIPLFGRLAGAYNTSSDSDMVGMIAFLDAWHACKGASLTQSTDSQDTSDVALREYPDQLSSKSAATDLLLKEAMDALTADLQAVYFQPLLDWIREDVRTTHAGDTGIDLVGITSITVRDRTLVQTGGTADSYFKFTPIQHLTMESLTGAKTLASGNPATADNTTQTVATDKAGVVRDHNNDPVLLTPGQQLALDPTTGLALRKGSTPTGDPVILTVPNTSQTKTPSTLATTIFGTLTPLQALALQAVLSADATVPSYRKLAPGTSLAIRPFVLPDGGSARVQMSLTSVVDADAPDTTKRDVPFDVIAKQTVTTEATISAFDLETVASFGVQTAALGDYAWRIPVLDQIPLLGDLFHGPRSRETKRQDSIALVNLTILPRSLDLVPFYVDAEAKAAADKAAASGGAKAPKP